MKKSNKQNLIRKKNLYKKKNNMFKKNNEKGRFKLPYAKQKPFGNVKIKIIKKPPSARSKSRGKNNKKSSLSSRTNTPKNNNRSKSSIRGKNNRK